MNVIRRFNGLILKYMQILIVNRKYLVGGKWFRYQRMKGVKDIGFKIAIGRYEVRFYKKQH